MGGGQLSLGGWGGEDFHWTTGKIVRTDGKIKNKTQDMMWDCPGVNICQTELHQVPLTNLPSLITKKDEGKNGYGQNSGQ